MREALDLARKGRALASPNPMVGAVLVRGGEVVGRGFHTYAGVQHAEVIALAQAGERARGATLYLNLEPCSHQGRTPPCVDALIQAGVARVVAPIEDPNPLVAGQGFRRLREAGIEVEMAAEFAAEAEKLNEPFLHFMRTGRPLVTLKTAITLDGKISAPDDNRGWITSERARAHVQELRHDHDAILTGIGTVLADDCLLTDRTGLARCRPLLRIVHGFAAPPAARFENGAQRRRRCGGGGHFGLFRRPAQAARGPRHPGADLRRPRRARGPAQRSSTGSAGSATFRCMIEAGSKINWTALESGVVDRIFFYYGPKILGGLEALPLAGGIGRRRRADAIRIRGVTIHPIPPDEFAVEGYVDVHRDY